MYYLVMSESGKGAREKTHTGYACNTGLEAMPTLQKKKKNRKHHIFSQRKLAGKLFSRLVQSTY